MPPQTSSSSKSQRSSSKNDSKTKTTSKNISSSKTSSKSKPATSSKDAPKTKTSKNSSQKSSSSTSKPNGKISSSKKDSEDVAKKNVLNDTKSKSRSSSSDKSGKPLPQNAYITGKETPGKSKVSKSSVETTKLSSRKEKDSSSRKEKDLSSRKEKDSSSRKEKDLSSRKEKDSSSRKEKDLSSRKEKDSSSRKDRDPSSRREQDSLRKEKLPSSRKDKDSSGKDRDSSLRKSVKSEEARQKTGSKEREPKKSRESSKSSSRNSNARSSTKSEKEKDLRSDRQNNTDSKPKEDRLELKSDDTLKEDEPTPKPFALNEEALKDTDEHIIPEEEILVEDISKEVAKSMNGPEEHLMVDPSHNSLDTLESGISMTSPNDLSDEGEVEESISSRFVEVDEMDLNEDDPSQISSSASPGQPSSLPNSSGEKEDEYDVDYEEDFENYESDFEDDGGEETEDVEETEEEEESEETSSEEEDEDVSPDPEMETVLRALETENNRAQLSRESTNMNGNDVKIQEDTEPSSSKPNRPKTARAYVNFRKAKERAKSDKTSERLKNRGQLLQEMITLDSVYIDLFSQISESYEAYIAAFGSSNRVQVSVQTNEDALSEDVQTDAIVMLEKWTQKPIHIAVTGDQLPTSQDYLGVGGDILAESSEDYNTYKAISSDSGRLSKFLSASSQVVLTLLEEEAVHDQAMSLSTDVDENLGFSNSGITLGSELEPLLEGRNCSFVKFCPSDPLLLLSGHGFIDSFRSEDNSTSEKEEEDVLNYELLESGALICLWLIYQPSFPKRLLACRSPPSVASFSPGRPTVVVAGLDDGSLAAWDLRESSANHTLSFTLGDSKWKLSPPSYITACSMENAYEGSKIVALEAIERSKEEIVSNYGSFQVVSLSSFGQLTWWVLVQEELRPTRIVDANNPGISTELGASPWSRITLSRTASSSVYKQSHAGLGSRSPESVESNSLSGDDSDSYSLCYDLKLSGCDPNQLYVATANGNVINLSRHVIKMHPPFFVPEIEPGAEAVSLAVCAHEPQYFLVGGSDGLLRLHCTSSSLPLTCWQASVNPAPVKNVAWSPSRPCVFYMLDTTGRFHVWDLSAGDIFPVISVDEGRLIGGQLQSFDIAKSVAEGSQALHAAFVSDSGAIVVRTVSPQFLRKNEDNYRSELERFKCYVNII